ncbi:alanine--tRNA ligase [Cellulosilyticum sp. I15G10I2]|uniref:alanine--tRNA ligase n=1 Tax=Cellulosilyticum sp. I15G10I2 TaxID=1892843 RepID=UPI00085C334C|nr:alanine--tRNA ligase [Cellulosilyticum sp. I15G10I2]
MKNYSLNELREMYLNFFESKNHLRMKSFPLVPHNDNSLLLINAGMAPLKPYFTGQEQPPRQRVTTCQKCIRTGDIENVGKTARHGTFFEMLGNFSFADYFKEEAIAWAWEFVTEVLELPKDRLFISVYEEDEEAAKIWHEQMSVPKDHIFYMGKDDNFWEVGVGPCGPCSEIYFDRGETFGCGKEGCTVGCDCDRYMEFWNLVFTQFNQNEDGTYSSLPNPNIDTGMGLERLAAMMQGVSSIFDVDTIKAIRDHVCKLAGVIYGSVYKHDVSIRVITDHIRSVTFMAGDGVLPSNEGRGYVMRRLLRRAVRHGKLLGIKGLFLKDIVKTVVDNSKHEYTELEDKYDYIVKLLTVEEERFNETIEKGLHIVKGYIDELQSQNITILSGKACFELYDTYGFPIDLTKEILEEKEMTIDEAGFKEEMEKQRQRARQARGEDSYMGGNTGTVFHQMDTNTHSEFVGYHLLDLEGVIDELASEDSLVDLASEGDTIYVVTTQTPFYAESGGQAGDRGCIITETGKVEVSSTSKVVGSKIAHSGKVIAGTISKGQSARFMVNTSERMDTARNHSATHLLQKALREVVGGHIEQAGSSVNKDRLRFDYTHFESLTNEQLHHVENLVNQKILEALDIEVQETSIDEARKLGATALFGEKYGSVVRVVNMGNYSIELCGGTHLTNTAAIGTFKIVSETGVAAGVRRIEAVTGRGALKYYQDLDNTLDRATEVLKSKKHEIVRKIEGVMNEYKILQKENEKLKMQISSSEAGNILDKVEKINEMNVLIAEISGLDMNALRNMGDTLKDKMQSGVVVLVSAVEDKVNLVVMATKDAVDRGVHCGNIISQAVKCVNGGGGGRPNMAQAGGKDPSKIKDALETAKTIIISQIN